jgi:hypothetical protein
VRGFFILRGCRIVRAVMQKQFFRFERFSARSDSAGDVGSCLGRISTRLPVRANGQQVAHLYGLFNREKPSLFDKRGLFYAIG